MSKLFSKLSPSFPEAANPLPSHNYEGVTLKLVVQEAKKQERAVSTLHNTQAKHIKSTDIYIFLYQSILENITININRAVEAF